MMTKFNFITVMEYFTKFKYVLERQLCRLLGILLLCLIIFGIGYFLLDGNFMILGKIIVAIGIAFIIIFGFCISLQLIFSNKL